MWLQSTSRMLVPHIRRSITLILIWVNDVLMWGIPRTAAKDVQCFKDVMLKKTPFTLYRSPQMHLFIHTLKLLLKATALFPTHHPSNFQIVSAYPTALLDLWPVAPSSASISRDGHAIFNREPTNVAASCSLQGRVSSKVALWRKDIKRSLRKCHCCTEIQGLRQLD